jgi:predicted NUDIX family phosphoesterase
MKGPGVRTIMVVEREALLGERPFQGFSPAAACDYESLILKGYRYAPRAEAEENPALKQPIAYCIIVNPREGLILAYRRAEREGDYAEKRLRGKWSMGVGGHIDPVDLDGANPIRTSMLRELGEEIVCPCAGEPRILGYINDDVDMVGKVHFGLLYRLDTDARSVASATREIAEARMIPAAEWRERLACGGGAVEGWSRIAFGPLLESF